MKTTYQITEEVIKRGNKKEMFNLIYLNGFTEVGSTLIEFEKDCSQTFCKDIATKGYDQFLNTNRVNLSEKQSWCLVFDILKNQDKFNNWVSESIKSLN